MLKMNKKMMATFAILIIALSVAGFAYAHWIDSVQIEGTVGMGSLTFGFTRIVGSWDSEDYLGYPPEKESATGVCTLSEEVTDVHSGKTVYKVLTFDITDAYPQYWAINKFTLDNAGTIPIKIQSVTVTLDPGFTLVADLDFPGAMWHVLDTDGIEVFNIWLYKEPLDWGYSPPPYALCPPWEFPGVFDTETGVRPLMGNQIEPCNELLTEICVDIKQTSNECHLYSFGIEIEAIQWNKYTPTP
jgi:hypothetical protein